MKLSTLVQSALSGPDSEIADIASDSREVRTGTLFAALAGVKADGAKFAQMAIERGAAAILAQAGAIIAAPDGFPILCDSNPRSRLAQMAARFCGAHPQTVVAVTGTNGKTSVANFVRQIWAAEGKQAASFGTVGAITPTGVIPLTHTTPDPVILHRMLRRIADEGVTHLALEASSHGLDQCRLNGLNLRAAAFTNLSRDHLDYHATLEDYFHAKLRLFSEVLPPGGAAIVNADIPEASIVAALARARSQTVIAVGYEEAAQLRLVTQEPSGQGQDLTITWEGKSYRVALPLAGAFQASNALVAAALALASGSRPDRVFEALNQIKGAPGRLEQVAVTPQGAAIYVDYAHTPDAISTVLAALRPHTDGRLWIVFGCGGDRDPGKRPLMGHAASAADEAIVTDDNPRTEDASLIRRAALQSAPGAREIANRAEAISFAVKSLAPGDVLVVAGKGHETGQIVGTQEHPFSDAEEVRKAVNRLEAKR
jgi:UDP-N-acetylmuramoyl-L-alanyl-D-glutamate--2,6-diaminopimelate ligase